MKGAKMESLRVMVMGKLRRTSASLARLCGPEHWPRRRALPLAARGLRAGLLVTCAALLLFAMPAQAQEEVILVSNLDDDVASGRTAGGWTGWRLAQQFTVEPGNDYKLTDVTISTGAGAGLNVSIRTRNNDGSPSNTDLYNLTAPSVTGAGDRTFTAPSNAILEKGTSYFVYITGPELGVNVGTTYVNSQWGISGWAISDDFRFRTSNDPRWMSYYTELRIELRGHVDITPDASVVAESTAVALSLSTGRVAEDSAPASNTVRGTLNGAARTTDTTVTLAVGDSSDSATEGTDYATINDLTLTIPAGQTAGTASFTLTPTDDDLEEGDETLSVSGTSDATELTVTRTTATIVDDDWTIDPPISSRTPAVRDAIVFASDLSTADDITALHLANIAGLDLYSESISSLSAGDFNGLAGLKTLDLSYNYLRSVPSGIFDDLVALQELQLEYNLLTNLPAGVFENTPKLRRLHLQYNELMSLQSDIFHNTPELRHLNLSSNNLTTLPADLFQRTPELYWLYLKLNGLTSAPPTLLNGLSKLFLLHMGYNGMSTPSAGFFVGLTSLRWLYLQASAEDPMPFTVSLEKAEEGRVKAVIPLGAPLKIHVNVTVENGSLADGATRLTIPVGADESEAIAVERTPGTTGAVTLDIKRLRPILPPKVKVFRGYEIVKATEGLPVEIYAGGEGPRETVALSLSTASVDENAAAASITVTGALSGELRTTDTVVTVVVGASGDTATEGTDYAAVNDLTLTISAGQTSGTASFTLTPTNDDVDEADETLSLTGSTTSMDVAVTGTTATIVDDDERGVAVSAGTLTVTEGSNATYTVVLESQPTATVTVSLSASGSSDVSISPSSLSFTTGNWDTAQTVTVSAAQDVDADDDVAAISHAVSGGDYASETASGVDVTVTDDDESGTAVSAAFQSIPSEHDGSTEFTVDLVFSEALAPQSRSKLMSTLAVTGATLVNVRVVSEGERDHWRIELDPSSDSAVAVSLAAGSDCATDPCTGDGRMLSQGLAVSIAGPPPPPPVTAAFQSAPTGHDGSTEFTVDLVLSEVLAPRSRSKLMPKLVVTGATLVNVRVVTTEVRDHWRIELNPTSDSDVTVSLAAGGDCASVPCTVDGRSLSLAVSTTIEGP